MPPKIIDSHRTLQEITDISVKNGTFKSLDLDEIKQMGHKLIADVGVYDVIRQECRDDYFYFVETVLNRVCPPNQVGVKAFDYTRARHFRWMMHLLYNTTPSGSDFMDLQRFGKFLPSTQNPWRNKKLILMPRAHGKTSVGDVGLNMWELYKNPNLRILILSEVRTNAVKFLGMIKDLYMLIQEAKNSPDPIPYYVMGDWKGDLWNEDEIKVKPRTIPIMTPSISTAGMESEIVSQHYDIICCDDPIGAENTTTPEQIDKHKRKLSSLTEVGDYDKAVVTQYRYFGTRWHYSDYYSVILDELTDQYDILKMACWDEKTLEPLFPEKYTTDILNQIKREKLTSPNPEEWANQWLNEPQDSATATFRRDSMNFYDNVDEVLKGAFVAIFGDTAWTENEWSCHTAFVPIAIGSYNNRYILPYAYFKTNNPEIACNKLISLAAPYYNDHRLRGVFIEEGPFFSSMYPIIADKAPWMPLIPLRIKNRNKDAMILNIASLTTYKKLYLRRDMCDLIEQLIRWPRYKNKDLANAVAYQFDPYPISKQGNKPQPDEFPDLRERFNRRKREQDNRRLYD